MKVLHMGNIEWQITDKKAARMVQLGVLENGWGETVARPDDKDGEHYQFVENLDPKIEEIAKTFLNPDEDFNPRGMPR